MGTGETITSRAVEQREPGTHRKNARLRWSIVLIWALALALLGWSLRQVPFDSIVQTLRGLHAWQLGALAAVNLGIFFLMALRWQLVLRGMGQRLNIFSTLAYRLAGFGISYFTPGPQFGGEPLQVLFLARRHGVPAPGAVSAVFLDRLLELLANFTFLTVGLVVIGLSNLLNGYLRAWTWPLAGMVLALPLLHLAALWRGKQPVTALLERLRVRSGRVRLVVEQAEGQIRALCADQPRVLVQGILLSGLVWLSLLGEYLLMAHFLRIPFGLERGVIALTLAMLAFLIPLPGGLGALEASQVLAMQLFGLDPALGLSLSLLMRARDVIFGGVGLALGGWLARG